MANNTVLGSDNFASGALAAGWAPSGTRCQVVVGSPNTAQVQLANGTRYGQFWNAATWPSSGQLVEVTLNSFANNGTVGCGLYCYAAGNFYVANMNGTGTINVSQNFGANLLSLVGQTYAAGDVYAFGVFGAGLHLYKNGARIGYVQDPAPLNVGMPGFDLVSSLAVNSVQVSSCRMYSAVQQDGVWQKQGIVIPANSVDLPYGAANPSNIIAEGNAQVLSGNVLKMWFTSWSGNAIGYAESPAGDGRNWTRRAGSVIAGVADPGVIKSGPTSYWLYAFAFGTGVGNGQLNAYLSSDGINFVLQASNIVPGAQYFFYPFAIIAGTWFALGNGGHLYTAAAGAGPWTDQGVVMPAGGGGPMCGGIANVNGTWFVWNQAFPTGGSPDGTETVRCRCTNPGTFTSWVVDSHSMHISQMYEAVNSFSGQSVPGGVIEIGGQTYMYSTQCPGDVPTPAIYQIALSIAPAPLAQVCAQQEDAMPVSATDLFTGGAGGLGPKWTNGALTALQVVGGNIVEPTLNATTCAAFYVGKSFTGKQWSEITIHAQVAGGNFSEPFVRGSTTSFNWYEVQCNGAAGGACTVKVFARPNGSSVQIGPSITVTLHVDDKIRLEVFDGTDGFPVLTVFQNGFSVLQVQDYNKTFLSGVPGFYMFTTTAITASQVSQWAGGNAGVLPYGAGGEDLGPGYDFTFRL